MATTKLDIENAFIRMRAHIFKLVGRGPLDDEQITKLLKPILGSRFIGAMSWDTYAPQPNKFAVVNTGGSRSKGVHWTGVYSTPKDIYIYDSFNRSPASLFPHLVFRMKGLGLKVRRGEVDKQQYDTLAICGQNSVAWCLLVHKYGITKARHL